jgi:hypothetical protein
MNNHMNKKMKDKLIARFKESTNRDPKPNELVNMENDFGLLLPVMIEYLLDHEEFHVAIEAKFKNLFDEVENIKKNPKLN